MLLEPGELVEVARSRGRCLATNEKKLAKEVRRIAAAIRYGGTHHADIRYGLTSPISWTPSPISRHCS